jgi:hypothetical protein
MRVIGVRTGHPHPHVQAAFRHDEGLLQAMGLIDADVRKQPNDLAPEQGMSLG